MKQFVEVEVNQQLPKIENRDNRSNMEVTDCLWILGNHDQKVEVETVLWQIEVIQEWRISELDQNHQNG